MFIIPNSTIVLYKNIDVDKDHQHTIYFENRAAQDLYFTNPSRMVYTFFEYSYIRETRSIRVGLDAVNGIYYADLYRCNYLRFKNTSFYDKWFYAFIDKIEYVNNNCAEIYFTIDPMQTWLIGVDWFSDDCYIEREHSVTDNIGDNLIEENMEVGDYVFGDTVDMVDTQNRVIDLSVMSLVVAIAEHVTWDAQYNPSFSALEGATYTGDKNVSALHYEFFEDSVDGMELFSKFMKAVNDAGKAEEIFAIFWFPTYFCDAWSNLDNTIPLFPHPTPFG